MQGAGGSQGRKFSGLSEQIRGAAEEAHVEVDRVVFAEAAGKPEISADDRVVDEDVHAV